ncbi:MAG: zinc ribbon domain-containing protein [Lentisphaeria bacterium]
MDNGIGAVLKLQAIDVEIIGLGKKCEAVPLVLQSFKNDLKVAEHQCFEAKAKVLDLESKFKIKEQEEVSAKDRIIKLKGTLESVRLPSEYEKISFEIEKIESVIDTIGEECFDILEQLEVAKAELSDSLNSEKRVKEELLVKEKDVEKRFEEFKSKLELLKSKRPNVEKELSSDLLAVYNRLKVSAKRFGVVCVELNEKSQCGFCHVKNSPERRIQLLNNQIVLCENCSSLLYLEK